MQPDVNKRPQGATLIISRIKNDITSKYQLYLLILLPLTYMIVFQYFPMYGLQIAFKNFSLRRKGYREARG